MFKNYHELLNGYVDFYSASLFNGPAPQAQDQFDASYLARRFFASHDYTSKYENFDLYEPIQQFELRDNSSDVFPQIQSRKHPSALNKLESSFIRLERYLTTAVDGGAHNRTALQPDLGSRLIDEDGRVITIGSFNKLNYGDFVHIVLIFIFLLLAKRLLVSRLTASSWLISRGLRPKDFERMKECIWRLLFYSFSSTWLTYTCFVRHSSHLLFSGSSDSSFVKYSFEVDWWSYKICMIETAFYLHATYALIWEDIRRRDTPMMLVHHLAAIFSVFSIYATRLTQIGLASVVLRDICDVLLEITKLIKCFHIQHGRRVPSLGLAIKFFLTIFTLAFAINQLYYYPLFCLYHGLNVIKVYRLQNPVTVGILTCGFVFLLLDCLWFLLILRLLYYIVLSGGKLEDIREYDDKDEEEYTISERPQTDRYNNNPNSAGSKQMSGRNEKECNASKAKCD